jgi:hypothetical protein
VATCWKASEPMPPYPATILGRLRQVEGFSDDGQFLILTDGTRYGFALLDKNAVKDFGERLLKVARLVRPAGEGWHLAGEDLGAWIQTEEAGIHGHPLATVGRESPEWLRRKILLSELAGRERKGGPHGEDRLRREVCAVAWFADDPDCPHLLTAFEEAGEQKFCNATERFESAASKTETATRRLEAVNEQLGARDASLKETIQPLTNLFSESALAEIRKRSVGDGVPELFVDWALSQFNTSDKCRLPTKGQAFAACGPETPIGRKLLDSGHGTSPATFALHLKKIREQLVRKGWLAARSFGKSRKLEAGFRPDGRFEDMNQPTPAETAADRDD